MKKLTLILFVALFMLSSTVFAATSWVDPYYNSTNTGGHTWQVDAFSNITSAVSATSAGSTIYVAYGTYNEAVRINKSLTLSGNMSRINSPIYEAFFVSGNNVVITGFNLTNLPSGAINSIGTNLVLNNNIIQNSTVANGYYPLSFTETPINPIYGGPTSGVNRAYHPFVIHVGSTYHFWYGDGANLRYTNATNRNLSDAVFPGTIVSGLNSSQPYKFSVYYNAAGWDLNGAHYAQPFVNYYTEGVGAWSTQPKIAVSDNGLNWTHITSVTGVYGYTSSSVYRMSVIQEGPNQWKGWADSGQAIMQAFNSTNGVNWTGLKTDILYRSNATYLQSWWETSGIGQISPNVVKVNGVYIMYYSSGSTANDNAIGVALSKDGVNFIKYPGNPIFSKFDGVAWRNDRTYNPYVMQDTDGNWYMYLMGRSSISTNYSVGIAQMNVAGLMNATQNFWGSEDGPALPVNNTLLGNITYCPWAYNLSFSIFTCVASGPKYSDIVVSPPSPQSYDTLRNYFFNVSWVDGSGVSSAWLNYNGINYSMPPSGIQYSHNIFGILSGSYYFWANDTLGTYSQTPMFDYIIKTTPVCTLSYSQTSPIGYNTALIVYCACNNTDTNASLYFNSEDITSRIGQSTIYPAGTNLFQCSTPSTTHFDAAQTNSTFTITPVSANPTISSSAGWTMTLGASTTINCTADGNVVPTLYKEGVYTGTNFETWIPAAGTFNYICNYTANANYSYAESYGMLTVTTSSPTPPSGGYPPGVSYILDARKANVTQNLTTPVSTTLTSPTPDPTGFVVIGGAFAGLLWFLVKP